MSLLKVKGNALGTGTVTLTAPNTSTDRTITLPDEDITLGGGVDGIVSTANATAITIDSSERVGISVTLPQELLHIKDGSIAVGNGTAANNTQVGRIGFSTDSANSRFIGMACYRGSDAANGDLRFHTYGGDSNAGERLRITNDGNVGIGVVPESWDGNHRVIEMGGQASIYGRSGINQIGIGCNVYTTAADVETCNYKSTDEAALYVQKHDGSHKFLVAPSGTADTAISWTAAMTIDNSGRVTMPYQPSFNATGGLDAVGSSYSELVYNTIKHNNGGHYSATTGRFTAPVSGYYLFTGHICPTGNAQGAASELFLMINNNTATRYFLDRRKKAESTSLNSYSMSGSAVVYLAANDFIALSHVAITSTATIEGSSVFSGQLLG